MKRFIFVLILFSILSTGLTTNHAYADTASYYAKVTSTTTMLYTSPSTTSGLFVIPYSYFVKVEAVNGDYYEVKYKEVSGYIKKSEVTLMSGTPTTAYLTSTFSIYTTYHLYAQPSTTSSVIVTVDSGQTFDYYGTRTGETVTSFSSDWYYSSLTKDGVTYFGYVYSCVTQNLTEFTQNNEYLTIVDESVFISDTDATATNFSALNSGTKALLVVAIAVPSVLILFFLVKPSKVAVEKTKNKGIRKTHHGDYFEYDD